MRDSARKLTSEYVSAGSWRMHALAGGPCEGLPIVLVHGLVISSRYMAPLGEELARDFRVYAPDLPGFGCSEKPKHVLPIPELAGALLTYMDAKGLASALLLGNSLGCQISLEAAFRAPNRVSALVLTGPSGDPRARNRAHLIGRLLRDWPFERPRLTWEYLKDVGRAGIARGWRTFGDLVRDRVEEKLARISAPTLVIRGSRDAIVSQTWAQEIAARVQRGSYIEMRGAPHCLNYSAPREVADLVRRFVREGVAGGAS